MTNIVQKKLYYSFQGCLHLQTQCLKMEIFSFKQSISRQQQKRSTYLDVCYLSNQIPQDNFCYAYNEYPGCIYFFFFQNFFFLTHCLLCLFIYFWLCWVFVSVRGLFQLWQAGATFHRGARASHYRGLSCCGALVAY